LIENVSGFLVGKNNAAPIIEAAFGEINAAKKTRYRLLTWVVDAADYGVPQHRRRAIAVAVVMFLLPKLPRTTPVVRTAVPISPTVSNTIEIKISIRVKPFWLLAILDADELNFRFAIS